MSYRKSYKKYFIIGVALFFLISFPVYFVEGMRGRAIAFLSLLFNAGNYFIKHTLHNADQLESENHLLRLEIGKLRALLEQKAKHEQLNEEIKSYSLTPKHCEEMQFLAGLMSQAIPARVIYRDPGSWSSSIWVNVGEETNQGLKRPIIQKNSPAILGRALVGAVDYVGKKQSRVRLITDSALKPSVRAVRGLPQNRTLIEHIDPIVRQLHGRADLFLTTEEKTLLTKQLEQWREKLSVDMEGCYLAKGILQGSGAPLWRSVNQTLRGIGFNYDFEDEEGAARELITGKPINDAHSSSIPILKLNDLLVTTGMDGVFPPGLRVAEVTKIYPLREGAYTYEIEASAVVGNLDTLQTIFIISPLGYEEEV